MRKNNNKWYKSTWFTILMLIIFFPVGLFLMWRYTNWKKWVKILITALLGIGLIVNISNGGSNNTQNSNNTNEQQSEKESNKKDNSKKEDDSNSSSSDKNTTDNYAIGDKVKVDKLDFTINNKETATQVGSNGLEDNANEEYVILDVTVKNNSNNAITVSDSFFKLKNDGKTYDPDSSATVTANQDISPDNLGFFGDKINPDSTKNAKVVFDVSSSVANKQGLKVQVQSGVFGTKTETINLSN